MAMLLASAASWQENLGRENKAHANPEESACVMRFKARSQQLPLSFIPSYGRFVGRRCIEPRSTNVLIESLGDSLFGLVADKLLDHLTTFEDQQGRDAGDFVAHRGGAVGVDIHFADFELALIVLGQLVDDGS